MTGPCRKNDLVAACASHEGTFSEVSMEFVWFCLKEKSSSLLSGFDCSNPWGGHAKGTLHVAFFHMLPIQRCFPHAQGTSKRR